MDRTHKVAEIIDNVIKDELGLADLSPTADLVDDLGMDSLDIVELIMHMEDKFHIVIPDRDCVGDNRHSLKMRTTTQWVDYIQMRLTAPVS